MLQKLLQNTYDDIPPRDIVEIDFPIPGEGYKVHPAVIVSNDDLQVDEGFVYVALISSQDFAYKPSLRISADKRNAFLQYGKAELCEVSDSGSNNRYRYSASPRHHQAEIL